MSGEIELLAVRDLTYLVGHDGSGRVGRVEAHEINLKALGASGVSTDDATSYLSTAIDNAVSAGKPLRIPKGTYSITQIDKTISGNLEIRMDQGAVIKGATGYATPVIQLDGSTSFPTVTLIGGTIDNSLRTFVAAGQSGVGLSLKRLSRFSVYRTRFDAGTNYSTDGGDSGITAQQVANFLALGCHFIGQPDLGIYLTGGSSTDPNTDAHDARIIGCHFEACQVAASAKRGYRRVIFQGNTVEKCYSGFTDYDTGTGASFLTPGQDSIVVGNTFHKTETRAIDIRMQSIGSIVSGNIIRDWGYLQDGATVSGNIYAIRLQGCTGVEVSHNDIAMVDWVATTHTAIDLPNFTAADGSSTVYQSLGNHVVGNKVSAAAVGIRASGAGPNILEANLMNSVATPYSVSDGSYIEAISSAGRGIGKTSVTSLTTAGIGLSPDGQLNSVRDGAAPLLAGRKTSYGTVLQMYKDGSLIGSVDVQSASVDLHAQLSNADVRLLPNGTGDALLGTASPATSAAGGFPAMPVCAGAPTGTAVAKAGYVPFLFDSTNNKLWVYNGAWKGVVLS
jgi:hypothetical protein